MSRKRPFNPAYLIAAVGLALPATAPAQTDMHRYYSPGFQPCLDSGVDFRGCFAPELKRWDDQLNATYRQLMTSLPPDRQLALRTSERAWIKKQAACMQDPPDIRGDIKDQGDDQCVLDATIDRVLYLRAYK
jgi:uncharacterized protein YecT (DUF1311 family)